jgi:outer membrane lipoprotein carrier protein
MKYNKIVGTNFNLLRGLMSLVTLLLIFPIFAFANAAQNLTAILNSTHTMQANFIQITGTAGNQMRTTGKMYLERPGKFRWEIISPNKQLIVANAKTVWIYDEDLAQVTKQNIAAGATNNPAMLLSGTIDLAKTFNITENVNDNEHLFILIPKNMQNSFFQKVQLTFHEQELSKMQIIDNLGQKSEIDFLNISHNAMLNQNLFVFKVPPNVDVIQ